MNTERPKLVLSGSSSLQDDIASWKNHFEANGHDVIAAPDAWDDSKDFTKQLTDLYTAFYTAIDDCDVFFLMNEDKNGIEGYIGANGTAELIYATMLNLTKNKHIDIYIAKMPSKDVPAYDEVTSFLRTGWIQVYNPL